MRKHGGTVPPRDTLKPMKIHARDHTPIPVVFRTIFVQAIASVPWSGWH